MWTRTGSVTAYNPLEKRALAESVCKALLAKPVEPLPPGQRFNGAGVYAIYYAGGFPPYQPVAAANRDGKYALPIYVGKAVPPGSRKGGFQLELPGDAVLYKRLREHAESVAASQNLRLADFRCRYLVVDDIWIPLGESLLIEMFSPLWNKIVDGFGNHDPGKGRRAGQRPPWDVIHPGREWADRCEPNRRTERQILDAVRKALSGK